MNSFDLVEHNQVKRGDILVGADGNIWKSGPYEIVEIKWSSPAETSVVLKESMGKRLNHHLFSHVKYNVSIRMMQYDPTQQGDTDEDI